MTCFTHHSHLVGDAQLHILPWTQGLVVPTAAFPLLLTSLIAHLYTHHLHCTERANSSEVLDEVVVLAKGEWVVLAGGE